MDQAHRVVLDSEFPRGTSVKIKSDALLRADTASRYQAYESWTACRVADMDEVRELEDRPPLPGSAPVAEGIT